MKAEQFENEWRLARASGHIDRVMRFADEGLVIGLGTVLSRADVSLRHVAVSASDPRLRALLAAAHLRQPSYLGLNHLVRAAECRREGHDALASMQLAMSGLDRLERPLADARRLFFADRLLRGGFSGETLIQALDLGPQEGALSKYDPDEPRVPAGSGRTSGEWTTGGASASQQASELPEPTQVEGDRSRDTSKIKIELPATFVCASPSRPITPFTEAVKKLADGIEVQESVSKWRELGPKGEALIRAAVQARGWELLGIQVPVRTRLGLRVEDVMVRVPPGATGNTASYYGFVEVKVNGGRYSQIQQDKDALIWAEGGILLRPVGGHRAGKRMKIGTGLANVTIPYEPG